MNLQRDIRMHLEIQLLIDISNKSQNQLRKDLHEERVIIVGIDTLLILEMQLEEELKVFDGEISDDLEGLELVDGLEDACDVVKVLEEGVGGAGGDVGTDHFMDLVDVLDRVCIDPDNGDDVEEDSSFGEETDVSEDSCVDFREEVLDDRVIGLEGFRIALTKVGVD